MIVDTLDKLKALPAFQEGWKNAGPGLLNFLGERLLQRARSGDAEAAKELASLIDALRTVGLADTAPRTPRMPALQTMP